MPHREAMKLAYRGLFTTPFPTDDMLRAEWRALLADPQATVLLGSSSGTPVGTLGEEQRPEDHGHDGGLEQQKHVAAELEEDVPYCLPGEPLGQPGRQSMDDMSLGQSIPPILPGQPAATAPRASRRRIRSS